MWLDLVGSVSAPACPVLELLRRRATLSRLRSEEFEAVTLSGSEGVDIWLSRSGAGVKVALCVCGRGPVNLCASDRLE